MSDTEETRARARQHAHDMLRDVNVPCLSGHCLLCDRITALASQLSEARVRVERLEGALRLIKRDWGHRVKAIGAVDPYEVARAALEGTGRAT